MSTCDFCGQPITFRYFNGGPTPIHINGNWCRGKSESKALHDNRPFQTVASYVNPNAICPLCGDRVFFYQSANGGRVFFDNLGWPWPKHSCTDNNDNYINNPNAPNQSSSVLKFRARDGSNLGVYKLYDLHQSETHYIFFFRRHETNKCRTGYLRRKTIHQAGLEIVDFLEAPSFVIDLEKSNGESLRVDFICGRISKIIKIKMSKKAI
jgi:hypothetical protein